MREILFRGKSCIGNWVYGYLKKQMVGDKADVWAIQTEGKEMLHLPATRFKPAKNTLLYENIVDPNTIGQFTGLTDMYGKKIFEGDICSYYTPEYHDGKHFYKAEHETGEVRINTRGVIFGGWQYTTPFGGCVSMVEIIGNIHDNKEGIV